MNPKSQEPWPEHRPDRADIDYVVKLVLRSGHLSIGCAGEHRQQEIARLFIALARGVGVIEGDDKDLRVATNPDALLAFPVDAIQVVHAFLGEVFERFPWLGPLRTPGTGGGAGLPKPPPAHVLKRWKCQQIEASLRRLRWDRDQHIRELREFVSGEQAPDLVAAVESSVESALRRLRLVNDHHWSRLTSVQRDVVAALLCVEPRFETVEQVLLLADLEKNGQRSKAVRVLVDLGILDRHGTRGGVKLAQVPRGCPVRDVHSYWESAVRVAADVAIT